MRLLLDTHALLWALNGNKKLPEDIAHLMQKDGSVVLYSIASLWELQIKKSLGKIELPSNLYDAVTNEGYELLNINPRHIEKLEDLPMIHSDPFDRIIVAQALVENLTLITFDADILRYNCNTITARS